MNIEGYGFYLLIFILAVILVFVLKKTVPHLLSKRKKTGYEDYELVRMLLNIDEEASEKILTLYKNQFGKGAARYAEKTLEKWKTGKVSPSRQTFERFFLQLPKVMDYDLKCRVLRHLMEEYGAKQTYELTVYTDNWEEVLEPVVKEIIDKPYTAELPAPIREKLLWLSEGEMQIGETLLKRAQVEEGKISVSMLRDEFAEIENLLKNSKGKLKVNHRLKFPYGKIDLEIRKR